jgi:hypothetical protein
MLVFKENVKGFIYDSIYGNINFISDKELSEYDIELIDKVISEDSILISDEEMLNELFEINSKEELEQDSEINSVVNFKE